MRERYFVSPEEVREECLRIAHRWDDAFPRVSAVYGVPRGGTTVAVAVAAVLRVPVLDSVAAIDEATLIVDDLVDSGLTRSRFGWPRFDALYRKPHTPADLAPEATTIDAWLVFPWERDAESGGPTDAVVRLLQHAGIDPSLPGWELVPDLVLTVVDLLAGRAETPP